MGLRRAGRALAGWLEKQRLERASNPGRLYARAHASHRLGAQKNSPSVARFWPGFSSGAAFFLEHTAGPASSSATDRSFRPEEVLTTSRLLTGTEQAASGG